MRRPAFFSLAFVVGCSAFASSDPDAPAAHTADAASPVTGPVFVGSRLQTFESAPITLLSPAGVQPGDMLLSAWLSGPTTAQHFGGDWVELGRTNLGDPNNGGVTTLIVSYHVLSTTENDATTYAFDGTGGQIATVAYRNAVRSQPVTPVTVSSIPSEVRDGGAATLDVPPFDTRGPSIPLYVFAIIGSTTYPSIPDLDRVEASSAMAVYRARTTTPATSTVAGPRLELMVGGDAPKVMVASLAVVGPP